jgi:hypothetical protein
MRARANLSSGNKMTTKDDQNDPSSLAYANLQPEQIIAALEDLGYHCDGRFLASTAMKTASIKSASRMMFPWSPSSIDPHAGATTRFGKNMILQCS